jgi:hypothetical protein
LSTPKIQEAAIFSSAIPLQVQSRLTQLRSKIKTCVRSADAMPPRKTRSSTRSATKITTAESVPDIPTAISNPVISEALKLAIDTMPDHRLRARVKHFCEYIPRLRSEMEGEFVIGVDSIVPYQASSDLEDSSKSRKRKRSDGLSQASKKRKLEEILVITNGLREIPRWATCDNCNDKFDLAKNEMGECTWHSGE